MMVANLPQETKKFENRLVSLLDDGDPQSVIEIMEETPTTAITDLNILRLYVYALYERNMNGDVQNAEETCRKALATCDPSEKSDLYTLLGRGYKMRYLKQDRTEYAQKCKIYYDTARILSQDPFDILNIINFLTFAFILGDDFSKSKIQQLVSLLEERATSPNVDDFWRDSTLLVLNIIKGKFSMMVQFMNKIVEHKPCNRKILSTLRNIIILGKYEGTLQIADQLIFSRSLQEIVENFLQPTVSEISIFALTLYGSLCRLTPVIDGDILTINFEMREKIKILTRPLFTVIGDNRIQIFSDKSSETVIFPNLEKTTNVLKFIKKIFKSEVPLRPSLDPIFIFPPLDYSGVETSASFTVMSPFSPMSPLLMRQFCTIKIFRCKTRSEFDRINSVVTQRMVHPLIFSYVWVRDHELFVSYGLNFFNTVSLREIVVSDEMVSDSDCADWVYQLLRGITFLHSRGVVHCYVCAKTVYLSCSRIKIEICDVPVLTKLIREESLSLDEYSEAAPELRRFGWSGVCEETDVWGFATVFCELNMRKPFTPDEVVVDSAWSFIFKCFEESPDARPSLGDLSFEVFFASLTLSSTD